MPGSGRSWHVGGGTCQDRGRSWHVGGGTCQDRGRSWHVGGGTCQDRGEVGMLKTEHARIVRIHHGVKKISRKNVKRSIDVYLLVSLNSLLVEGVFFRKYPTSTLLPPAEG